MAALDELETDAVWIRPDRYIGAVCENPNALVDLIAPRLRLMTSER